MKTAEYCDKLNKLITEKKEGYEAEVANTLDEYLAGGGDLYWNRDIYIECGFDEEKMHNLLKVCTGIEFVLSDDPVEHQGIVVRYIPKASGTGRGLTVGEYNQVREDIGISDWIHRSLDCLSKLTETYPNLKSMTVDDAVSYLKDRGSEFERRIEKALL